MIILKVTKKQGFILSLEDAFFWKSHREGQIDTPSRAVLRLTSAFTVSVSISVFTSSVGIPLVITSSAIGLNIWMITAGIKSKEKKKTLYKTALSAKS